MRIIGCMYYRIITMVKSVDEKGQNSAKLELYLLKSFALIMSNILIIV